jgi:hypothetical protein
MKSIVRVISTIFVVCCAAACGGAATTGEPTPTTAGSGDVSTSFGDMQATAHRLHDGSIQSTLSNAQGPLAEMSFSDATGYRWEVYGRAAGALNSGPPSSLESVNTKLHGVWGAMEKAPRSGVASNSPSGNLHTNVSGDVCLEFDDGTVCCGFFHWTCCTSDGYCGSS